MGVYLGKNRLSLYFSDISLYLSRYIGHIAIHSAIYRYISFDLPSLTLTQYRCMFKAASTSVCKCRTKRAKMKEILMWTCSRGTENSICLCSEHSVNSWMLSVWSRYFKEKYVRNHTDVNVYFTSKNKSGIDKIYQIIFFPTANFDNRKWSCGMSRFQKLGNSFWQSTNTLHVGECHTNHFLHLFEFASLLLASFSFSYRCRHTLIGDWQDGWFSDFSLFVLPSFVMTSINCIWISNKFLPIFEALTQSVYTVVNQKLSLVQGISLSNAK